MYDVNFKDQNIVDWDPDVRAKEGIFLAFQYPTEVPGVPNSEFLRVAFNSICKHQGIDEMDVTGFISRIRGTDFFTTPTRFVGGGHINLLRESQDSMGFDAAVGLNYINTWDDLRSGEANTGIRNAVYTIDFDFTVFV